MSSNIYSRQGSEKPKSNAAKKDGTCGCGCSCCGFITDEMKITRPGTVVGLRRASVEWDGTGELKVDEKGDFTILIVVEDHFNHTDLHGEETNYIEWIHTSRVKIHRDCDIVANLKYPIPFEESSRGTQLPDISPFNRQVAIKTYSGPPEEFRLHPKTLAIASKYFGWEIDPNGERRYFDRDFANFFELFNMVETLWWHSNYPRSRDGHGKMYLPKFVN